MANKKPTKSTTKGKRKTTKRSPAFKLPNFHVAVNMGLVKTKATGDEGVLRYDWAKIRDLWAVAPQVKIKDFAHEYGLPYEECRRRLRLRNKIDQAQQRVALAKLIRDEMRITHPDVTAEAARVVSRLLNTSVENLQAVVTYVSARMMNVQGDGSKVANLRLDPREVAQLTLTQQRATNQLTALMAAQKELEHQNEPITDPAMVVEEVETADSREVLGRIHRGGTVTTSEGSAG